MRQDSHAIRIAIDGRHLLWSALLIAASVAFSLGFACAVPFAGFAAFAALTANRSEALLLVFATFLANQCVGFGLLDYPRTAETFAWGGVLGAVSLLATLAADWAIARLPAGRLMPAAAAFVSAFIAYEGLLFAATAVSGDGFAAYTPLVIARILGINLAAFVGLLALHRLAGAVGLIDVTARPAASGGSAVP